MLDHKNRSFLCRYIQAADKDKIVDMSGKETTSFLYELSCSRLYKDGALVNSEWTVSICKDHYLPSIILPFNSGNAAYRFISRIPDFMPVKDAVELFYNGGEDVYQTD